MSHVKTYEGVFISILYGS